MKGTPCRPRPRVALVTLLLLSCGPAKGVDPLPNGDCTYSACSTGLRKVVNEWTAGGSTRSAVVAQYGNLSDWNTSGVTNMRFLFFNST